jgi:putative transposase
MDFQRKTIRLPASEYHGKRIYFLTICCHQRHSLFTKESVGLWAIKLLTRSAAGFGFVLHAYCVMPNHIHILAEATRESCQLPRFISTFKQRTGYLYQQTIGSRLWQTHYYDHLLRRPEDTEAVAWYIWLNPVRKGLCSKPQDYSLSGSLTIDWKKRCSPTPLWVPPWKPSQKLPG